MIGKKFDIIEIIVVLKTVNTVTYDNEYVHLIFHHIPLVCSTFEYLPVHLNSHYYSCITLPLKVMPEVFQKGFIFTCRIL